VVAKVVKQRRNGRTRSWPPIWTRRGQGAPTDHVKTAHAAMRSEFVEDIADMGGPHASEKKTVRRQKPELRDPPVGATLRSVGVRAGWAEAMCIELGRGMVLGPRG
jgi:hypothetical protein